MISLFTFPAMAGIAALSGPLTRFVFGEEFAPAAFPMAALAIHGAIQSLLFMQGSVFLALNRVDIMFRWSVITVVVLVVFLLVGVQWGLEGASLGYLAATLICAPLNFRALLSLIGARLADAWAALRVHTTITVFMALAVYGLTLALPANWPPLFVLMAGIPAGVILYVGGLAVLDRKAITEVIGIVRSILARKSAG
jgi:PST family polysaccharide transporter